MRFEFLVAAVAAGGLAVGVLAETGLPSINLTQIAQNSSLPQSGAPTKITFGLQDLNPLRYIYDLVMNDVATSRPPPEFAVSQPPLRFDPSWFERQQAQFKSEFDPAQMQRWNAERIQMQIRDNNQKAYDMAHGIAPY
jgi:hypothetical protein